METHLTLQLTAAPEQQNLSALLAQHGVTPSAEVSIECSIPAHARVMLFDDLQLHGYGKVTLRFAVHADAQFEYLLRDVAGMTADEQGSPHDLDRSITCVLAGARAHAAVRCLYFGNEARRLTIKTRQDHQAVDATSTVVVKAVLTDTARLTCHSMISVAPGANGTLAEQVNKNILLSRTARAVSIPMLEVLANDVKCKHGAAISTLDEEQKFYLQSRGLTTEQTRAMLLAAFLS